ncbi:MAG: type 4a pilus biogenesis protein PilO [Candidatus Omnitrophica bacterium]|nr:type 4a pilus biogenesis protein PilO [Candidatus Omnitrophota bacterium]
MDRKKIILAIFVFFILDLLVIFPFQIKCFVNLFRDTGNLKRKISLFKQELNSPDLFREQTSLKQDIERLQSKIIVLQDISTVLTYISRTAKANNVEIQEISAGLPKEFTKIGENSFYHVPINIEAQANFHDLAWFMNTVEEGKYFIEVKELNIQKGNPYHRVKMSLILVMKGK